MLDNILGITNKIELIDAEEKLSKIRAKEMFELERIEKFEIGTFKGLKAIHYYLFQDIYPCAGEKREINISKGNFRFVPVMYLDQALSHIDKMPMNTFDEIVEKYVEMNIAHPFREGNGRSTRIWLDLILKKHIGRVIDWNAVDKEDYLLAMERSPVKDIEIKYFLRNGLTENIHDKDVYLEGIDISYYYEGYTNYLISELNN